MASHEDGGTNIESIELKAVEGSATHDDSFAAQQQRAQALIAGEGAQQAAIATLDGEANREPAAGSAAEAQAELSRLLAAASSRQNTQANVTRSGEADGVEDGNQAISVRTNMLINYWNGYNGLSKFRKWILILRLLIALVQIVAGITVLALPTSLGDSFSFPETCDPEGMFVYLVLHISRVACSMPIDLYLGLSPHRSPRARRRGAEGLAERERNRRVGSLRLDRKLGRLGDLLGFCHVVLFIVGNYVVWTSVECSHAPADSKPLFFTCVAMLSITYLIILEVALMVFLVIFFLPLLIAILNALGLSHRLPQRDIHPETGKISQQDIEKYSRIVYFTPLLEDLVEARRTTATTQLTQPTPQEGNGDADVDATQTQNEADVGQIGEKGGLFDRFSLRGKKSGQAGTSKLPEQPTSTQPDTVDPTSYPLFPIPAHRATCPICLVDYEAPSDSPAEGEAEGSGAPAAKTQSEPLRLLRCGHVMHKACVDQWLTAVSGRCPVCQRPVIGSHDEDQEGQGATV